MTTKNRIIALIDLSKGSNHLVVFAMRLSKIVGADLVFVNRISTTIPSYADLQSREDYLEMEKNSVIKELHELTKGMNLKDNNFMVSTKPIMSILEDMQSKSYCDWVVSGLKPSGLLKRFLIGTTPLKLINESRNLTISVPTSTFTSVPKKLIVGVSPNYPINQVQFENLLQSLKGYVESIEFFSILSKEEEKSKVKVYYDELKDRYKEYNISTLISQGEDKFKTIIDHVGKSENSFLVLQQGSRNLEDQLFRKFMINEIVYSAQTPLIVLSK